MIVDPDSFIYNFIFDLGKYYPLEISLLGGRFFTSYSEKITVWNDTFISEYKSFLLERLTSANTYDSKDNSTSIYFIEWIKYFIEYELINIEYREIYKKWLTPDGQTRFSINLFHIIFDIFFYESISLANKIDAFILRLKKLPEYFNAIFEQLEYIPFTSILELFYSSSVISEYLKFIEEKINAMNINLLENSSYSLQKSKLIQYFATFKKKTIEALQNYTFPDINIELRKINFLKTLEYTIPKTNINIEFDIEGIAYFKNELVTKFIPILKIDIIDGQLLPELLKISKKTKVPSDALLEQYQKIYDEITNNLILPFSTKEKKELPFQKITFSNSIIAFNNLFISSSRLKRNYNPKFIVTTDFAYLGTIFLTTLIEIIPSSYFLETAISASYIYNVLRITETEQALKMFLIYLYLQLDTSVSPDVQATLLYQLIFITEMARFDIIIHTDSSIDRTSLVKTFQNKFSKSELESEQLFEKLFYLPGFYYTAYLILQRLINAFKSIRRTESLENSTQKILRIIEQTYGAPPKLIFKELERIAS